jgi:hypothetical protein
VESGDEKTSRILLMMPFNIRTDLPREDDLTLCNQVAGFPFPLPLCSDFLTAIKCISRDMKEVKTKFLPLGTYYLTGILTLLTPILALPLIKYFAGKPTLTMTNVFGPPTSVSLSGSKSKHVYALLPSMAEISGGFALVSHGDIAKMSFIADTSRCTNSSRVIEIFEANMDAILKA